MPLKINRIVGLSILDLWYCYCCYCICLISTQFHPTGRHYSVDWTTGLTYFWFLHILWLDLWGLASKHPLGTCSPLLNTEDKHSRDATVKKREFLIARAIYEKSKMAFETCHADEKNAFQPLSFWVVFEQKHFKR